MKGHIISLYMKNKEIAAAITAIKYVALMYL